MNEPELVQIRIGYFASVWRVAVLRPWPSRPPRERMLWWIVWAILTAGLGAVIMVDDVNWLMLFCSPVLIILASTRKYWLGLPIWVLVATIFYRRELSRKSLSVIKSEDRIFIGDPSNYSLVLIPAIYAFWDQKNTLTIYAKRDLVPIIVIPKTALPAHWIEALIASLTEKIPPLLPRQSGG